MTHASTLSAPFYGLRPKTLPDHLPSVQMMSVDILPASIPLDASKHFSKALTPYLDSLIEAYSEGTSKSEFSRALDRATIAMNGKLVEKHQWLQPAVDTWYSESVTPELPATSPLINEVTQTKPMPARTLKKKNILMLGSGMVAGPAVDEIAKRGDIQLVIGRLLIS